MKKRMLFTAAALAASICLAAPAMATESAAPAATEAAPAAEEKKAENVFTTEDGVLSIKLPNEKWAEVADPLTWVVLSDGTNVITAEHYANGEKLPEISVANSHYVDVYQAAFSTQNEVFIITGSVADAADISDVCNAIMSAKVLKYDTKKAVVQETPKAQDFSIKEMNETYYVTAEELNVRRGCSTQDAVLGALKYGTAVNVTGAVQKDGQDFGWYRISFNGGTGYVSGKFLTKTKPETAAQPEKKAADQQEKKSEDADDYYYTGDVMTIYDADGDPVTVRQSSDGHWYDSEGNVYYEFNNDGRFQREDGEQFTDYRPSREEAGSSPTGFTMNVYYLNGNMTTLSEYSDGAFYTPEMQKFHSNGDGTFTAADGTTLYEDMPHPEADDDDYTVYDDDDDNGADDYDAQYDDTDDTYDDTYEETYDDTDDVVYEDTEDYE